MKEEDRQEQKEQKGKEAAQPEETKAAASPAPVDGSADAALAGLDGGVDAKPGKVAKDRNFRRVPFGVAHVRATFNNTLVTITDMQGGVVAWSSSGRVGFIGSRKSTAFAAGRVGQEAARQAMARGVKEIEVRVQGPGAGRETAIRALQSSGLTITVIKDVTPMPHDGCRPRKRRRV